MQCLEQAGPQTESRLLVARGFGERNGENFLVSENSGENVLELANDCCRALSKREVPQNFGMVKWLGMVIHTCNPNTPEAQPGGNSSLCNMGRPCQITAGWESGSVAECLPSVHRP
jgi:hypothetical protein